LNKSRSQRLYYIAHSLLYFFIIRVMLKEYAHNNRYNYYKYIYTYSTKKCRRN